MKITKEKWDRAFELTIPLVSVGIGILSLAITIMTVRAQSLAQRVYYHDSQYLVSVRRGQWYDLRDFVQPDNPDIIAILAQIGPDPWSLYNFVCREIDYRGDIGEFWFTPSETLASKRADCEDTAILLCSLLRCFTDAHVALGEYQGYGHAWCQLKGDILETTYRSARPVPDPQDYCLYVLFNEREVIELWPNALNEVFSLQRNEQLKLCLMAEAIDEKV